MWTVTQIHEALNDSSRVLKNLKILEGNLVLGVWDLDICVND